MICVFLTCFQRLASRTAPPDAVCALLSHVSHAACSAVWFLSKPVHIYLITLCLESQCEVLKHRGDPRHWLSTPAKFVLWGLPPAVQSFLSQKESPCSFFASRFLPLISPLLFPDLCWNMREMAAPSKLKAKKIRAIKVWAAIAHQKWVQTFPCWGGGGHCSYCSPKAEALLLRNSLAGYVSSPKPPAGDSSEALLAVEKAALFDRSHPLLFTRRRKHFFTKKIAFRKMLQKVSVSLERDIWSPV